MRQQKWLWKIAGWAMMGLAVIGTILPVMPTVPFLIVAAFCFERGSPELHKWLMEHKTFGPGLRDWYQHRVIQPRVKIISIFCILCSMTYIVIIRDGDWPLKIASLVSCSGAIGFILYQRSHRPK